MAKKKQKLNVAALCGVVAAVLGIVAILMELLTGYSVSASILGTTSVTNYSVFNLIFGCDATATVNDNGDIVVNHVNAGLLIAFILLIIGVLGSCCGAFLSLKDAKKGALVACLASLCLVVAGILFLCTKSLTGLGTGDTSKEGGIGGLIGQYGGVKTSIGAGVYLTGIIGIVAGVADCPVVLAGFKK